MRIEQFFVEGLGHQSYCVADGEMGAAAIIDPRRDVDVYLDAAGRMGARITHVLETHLHNDYVTGARELAARTGATIVTSADAQPAYSHMPVHDGDRIDVGGLRFVVMATPGHTPEHVSYILYEQSSGTPHAVFSGGSMLVGGAGRTDLLDPALTLTLTRQQYHSLRRLLDALPGTTLVYPTHGAGSFCVANAVSSSRHTTIAQEQVASPGAQAHDEADFVQRQLAGYGAFPRYYARMRAINQAGPRILGSIPASAPLSAVTVRDRMAVGTPLVDGRNRDAFAHEHVPGAIHIELDESFGTYAGWILPFDEPLMLVVEDEAGRHEAVVQLVRIGYEHVLGHLDGGMAAWRTAGYAVRSFERIEVPALFERWHGADPPAVLDVRRDEEWRTGHIPDARHIHVADLPERVDELPRDRPMAVICASGYRASTAASILAATGRMVIAVQGGVPDWIGHGYPTSMETQDPLATRTDPATHAHP